MPPKSTAVRMTLLDHLGYRAAVLVGDDITGVTVMVANRTLFNAVTADSAMRKLRDSYQVYVHA